MLDPIQDRLTPSFVTEDEETPSKQEGNSQSASDESSSLAYPPPAHLRPEREAGVPGRSFPPLDEGLSTDTDAEQAKSPLSIIDLPHETLKEISQHAGSQAMVNLSQVNQHFRHQLYQEGRKDRLFGAQGNGQWATRLRKGRSKDFSDAIDSLPHLRTAEQVTVLLLLASKENLQPKELAQLWQHALKLPLHENDVVMLTHAMSDHKLPPEEASRILKDYVHEIGTQFSPQQAPQPHQELERGQWYLNAASHLQNAVYMMHQIATSERGDMGEAILNTSRSIGLINEDLVNKIGRMRRLPIGVKPSSFKQATNILQRR